MNRVDITAFLAVQDSSIGDIVSDKFLISAAFERLVGDLWETFKRL